MSNYPNNQYGGQGYGGQYNQQQQGDSYGQYPNQQPQYGGGSGQQGQQYGGQQGQNYQGSYNQSNYGPPADSGFVHGQQYNQYDQKSQQPGGSYGQDAPQGGYYNRDQQYQQSAPGGQFPQQGPYNQNPYPSDPSNPYSGPGGAQEGDRGLMGALAGGAAGAAGGHQMGHGLLGAIGGAIVGSLTEDYGKKKYKEHQGRPGSSQSHHSNSGYGGGY